ncbi:unnamed protein product [Triticum turgidum subsp. durum]|uniref:Kinesin motor domain-containing protein n=1 Tax=Triticum turgidum subsp. durum TaxID=4567 RepID=A0A9R0ZHT9_TRITD|nr:unnamed protein product [Triticum turgidum subsp. durum]
MQQNNLMKAREEKYKSRIRVLEALASGTSGQIHVSSNAANGKAHVAAEPVHRMKMEKDKFEEKRQLLEEDQTKLTKDKENENRNFEQRIKEVELKLEDSTKRERYLEELLEARIQTWEQKEIMLNQFVGLQMQNIQDLRLSSVSIRHEIQNCQKRWSEELSGLGQSLKVLANASEKYHAALEENRKLFNEVQELKGNIRVFCRIRPFLPNEDHKSSTTEITGDNGELILANPTKIGKEGNKLFKFNKVLGPTTSQDEVFRDIQPLVRSVLDGYNVCIFAYGQTGSGKTYTMTGPEDATEEELGVNFRALNDLFLISRNRGDTFNYEVSVQMIEIYNEQIHDLLGSNGSEKNLGILNSSHPNGLAVPDATLHPVNSTTDVIELMRTGLGNRSVGATALNERSSRSHSVVTVHVQGEDLKTGATLRGALHLVDLAGSERVDRSAVTGDRLKEAQHINKSLSALGDVIFSLSQKTSHVPYRNSKLTQVLQSSLGGHAKTLMFVQINPDVSSYAESLSTLRFAERVSGVELGAAKANKEGKDIKEFKEQLSLLKDKIAKKDEEINQLQTHSPRVKTGKRADSLLKHSSSSPGISSLGSKMQHRRTASGGKAMGLISRAGSDADNFSEISDRHSETSSMQSIDDIQQQREIMVLSKLPEDDMGPNSADPELASFGYADSEGRLSDISDSGISMGTETDGSISSMVDFALFPEQEKIASTWKEQETAPNTPKDRL